MGRMRKGEQGGKGRGEAVERRGRKKQRGKSKGGEKGKEKAEGKKERGEKGRQRGKRVGGSEEEREGETGTGSKAW